MTNQKFGVDIIRKGVIYSDFSKVYFNEEQVCIRGGIFYRQSHVIPLSKIACLHYTSIFPKMRLQLTDSSNLPNLQATWFSKKKFIRFLEEQGVSCWKWENRETNLFRRISNWYSFWYQAE